MAANNSPSIQQQLKMIVNACSSVLREPSVDEATSGVSRTELKNLVFGLYDSLLSSFSKECELLIGNEISLILLHLGDE